MSKAFIILFLVCTLGLSASAQVAPEPTTLVPDQPVERQIAGGDSHVYQINLTAGQFVRFHLDQRAIDSALTLTAPDGKEPVEMDLTGVGEEESLSREAATSGRYRLTLRGNGPAKLRGSYRLEAAVQASATAQDRQRLTAEALLVEVKGLRKQRANTAQQAIEKLQQALGLWRELREPAWTAYSLYRIGSAYRDLSEFGKAIEYYEQALATQRGAKLRASEANTLADLGTANWWLHRYEKGIEFSEQALVIHREVKNRASEGTTLNSLGVLYFALSRSEKAVSYFEQGLVIAREVKDLPSEATALNGLGPQACLVDMTKQANFSSRPLRSIAR
jgi:tetratricopeptide (TPR) repeat protein